MSTIRAAVIGCGDISVVHFDAIARMPNVELVAVCDTDPERLAEAVAARGVPGFIDYRDLLADVRPDVVHICTPHHQHASIAIDALEAGVEVIQEKPLAHTRGEGQRLVEVAERTSTRIGICFQNRYNAPVQAAFELLRSGTLGEIRGASGSVVWQRDSDYYLSRPWRGQWATAGGGLLMNQAIHTLDLLQWLVGQVTGVRGGAGTRYLDTVIEVEDTADMVLQHANGARSVFYATLANVVNSPVTIEIVTTLATLRIAGDLTISYSDGRIDTVQEREVPTGGRAYWGVSHERLIQDFYDGVGSGERFWIDPGEAQKSLSIIQDVYDEAYPNRREEVIS